MIAGWTKVSTPNYQRWTEGYYYLGPPWAGSSAGEYSQDEARHFYPNDPDLGKEGNTEFAQGLIFDGILVPRLYSKLELGSWGGPPGGYDDYQRSLWASNPTLALQQFLANVPQQYRANNTPAASSVVAASLPPPILSSVQTVLSNQLPQQATPSAKGATIAPFVPVTSAPPAPTQATGLSMMTFAVLAGIAVLFYLMND